MAVVQDLRVLLQRFDYQQDRDVLLYIGRVEQSGW
jgi:hypothetical protein